MDDNTLNLVVLNEISALRDLLDILEEQHNLLISNDIYKLEELVDRIQICNKVVAENEVKRRKITVDVPMKDIVEESKNNELKENYRKIIMLLEDVKTQKETNEILIKMGLGYSTKMLNILSPNSNNSTVYTSRGNYKK